MTNKQNNRVQRGVRVINTLVFYNSIWTLNTVMTATKLAIVNSLARIAALVAAQSTSISGNTQNKMMNCIFMATPGANYAATLLDWAIATGNGILAGEIAFSFTDLSRGPAEQIVSNNELVQARLATNMTALIAAGYPVTAANAISYLALINTYVTDVPLWKNASSTKKTTTQEIALELNNLTITLFASLKRNLLTYNVPVTSLFYGTCMNAMRTVNSGTRRIYLRVKFIDSVTGLPITGVTCILVLDATDYSKLCSKRGYATYYSLSNGNGMIKCSKTGYRIEVISGLAIQDGNCLKLTVAMTMGPLAIAAKPANGAKETKEVVAAVKEGATETNEVVNTDAIESPIVPEAPGKKRKKVAKKVLMNANPAVVKMETVRHKTKGK